MKITIVGAYGSIAMLLHPILIENGHTVRGLIRKEEQKDELRKAGAEPIICDIEKEDDISTAVGEADAVLFAAGAGAGSAAEKKKTVDRDGAIKLIKAAQKNDINRYVIISSMGADVNASDDDEAFQAYLQAKGEADEALRNSGLDYTIIKPGSLTDEEGTGKIKLAPKVPRGEIPRADVAALLGEVLETPNTAGYELEVISGDTFINEAVERAVEG